jgi:hypothetical protein
MNAVQGVSSNYFALPRTFRQAQRSLKNIEPDEM